MTLSDASKAATVPGLAKSLRRSIDETVRTNVDIDMNQAADETKAAFKRRCAARSRRSENEVDVRFGEQVDQQRDRPTPILDGETGCRLTTSGLWRQMQQRGR